MPTSWVHHLVPAIVGEADHESSEIAVLPPRLLPLVAEAPRDVALAWGRAVHRRLVLEECDGLEGPEVEPLDGDEDAGIGAVDGEISGGAGGGGEGRGGIDYFALGGGRERERGILRGRGEVFAGFDNGGVDLEGGVLGSGEELG